MSDLETERLKAQLRRTGRLEQFVTENMTLDMAVQFILTQTDLRSDLLRLRRGLEREFHLAPERMSRACWQILTLFGLRGDGPPQFVRVPAWRRRPLKVECQSCGVHSTSSSFAETHNCCGRDKKPYFRTLYSQSFEVLWEQNLETGEERYLDPETLEPITGELVP